MIRKFLQIWRVADLRKKILMVLFLLAVTRVLAAIPIPGVNVAALQQFFNQNQLFGLLDIFSGGGLSNFSIAMMGVGPYITASIIIQLMAIIIPSLGELQKEGEQGRVKINQYTRYLTVPLAILQGFGTIALFTRGSGGPQILGFLAPMDWVLILISITAGTLVLMWIGELITEYGIGNGLSLIIFAGIVAQIPTFLSQAALTYNSSQLPTIIGFALIAVFVILAIVTMTEATRNIPVSYAKRVRGNKLYGGVLHLFRELLPKLGISVTFVENPYDLGEWERAIRPNTKFLALENPSNPLIDLFDPKPLVRLAHSHGTKLVVDNTLATPVLMQPLKFGVDIVWHSLSKYFGDGEVIGGCILGKKQLIDDLLNYSRVTTQANPFEDVSLDELIGEALVMFELRLAESGGQVADTGTLEGCGLCLAVQDVQRNENDLVVHRVACSGALPLGLFDTSFVATVDGARRQAIRRNHTATHLLHRALRDLLGEVLAKTTHYRGYLGDELDFLADLGLDSRPMELAVHQAFEPRIQRFVDAVFSTLPPREAEESQRKTYFQWLP